MCYILRMWLMSENPNSGWNRLNDLKDTESVIMAAQEQALSARVIGARIIAPGKIRTVAIHSHHISSQAYGSVFFMRSSCCLQMHKVPFGAKFSISFSTSRHRLAPLTCLTNTQGQCFKISHVWGHHSANHLKIFVYWNQRNTVGSPTFYRPSFESLWGHLDQYIYRGNCKLFRWFVIEHWLLFTWACFLINT